MGTYIIRDVQDFLIERWGQKQMRSDVDLQLAAHAKQVRLENAQLREQNRVLRSNLVNCAARLEAYYGEDYPAVRDAKAALTATSQPAQEQCSYCKRPLTDNHSFSYGVPGVPRVYKCDRADCTKPATSQEGQHG